MAPKYKKRQDGRYLAQIQIGVTSDGKPKYKNIYSYSSKELESKVREFKSELDKGIVVDAKGMTVGQWAQKWLSTYKSGTAYYTQQMYSTVINAHIIPSIGHIPLKNLKTYHVQEMINLKANEGLTRTLEKIKVTMNQIVKQAIINEFIYKNIMLGVEIPKTIKQDKRALTKDEIRCFEKAFLTQKERVFICLLQHTGIRRGEALALTVSDIDFKENTLSVHSSVIFKGNKPEIKSSPKSQSSVRKIPLTAILRQILFEYKSSLNGFLLFPNTKGELMSLSSFRFFWGRIISKAEEVANAGPFKVFNINNDITPHIFRHTYATALYSAGIDIKTAQYLLGHSSIQMTMDIYTHLDKGKTATVSNALDAYFNSIAN